METSSNANIMNEIELSCFKVPIFDALKDKLDPFLFFPCMFVSVQLLDGSRRWLPSYWLVLA